MAAFDLITKDDLVKFKIELFAELKRPSYKLNKKEEQKEWIKSYEVHALLNISAGTLATVSTPFLRSVQTRSLSPLLERVHL